MEMLEIVLLIAGAVVFVISFLLPQEAGETKEETKALAKEEIKAMVSKELEGIKGHVDDVVDEAIGYAVEKTERSLERLTNEKIMAVNEYSDTVMKEIHRNHEEAMFLYDMLNSKHQNLKDTVSEVNKTVKEAAETTKEVEAAVTNFQKFVPEQVEVSGRQGIEQEETVNASVQKKDVNEKLSAKTGSKAKSKTNSKIEEKAESGSMDISFMAESDNEGRNSNEKILELHKKGKSTVAIAKELGLGVGEVKLVIDLHKNM